MTSAAVIGDPAIPCCLAFPKTSPEMKERH